MAATREQIMNALLAQLKAKCGSTFLTYDRKMVMWQDLVAMITSTSGNGLDPRELPRFPALYLYDGVGFGARDVWVQGSRGTPSKRTLYRTIVLYAWRPGGQSPAGASSAAGAITMNPLIEAVEAAFDPTGMSGLDAAVGSITLGGLVQHAWIEGDGHCIPGDIDPSGLAMQTIPVAVLVP